jgi:hypothetical protein
MSEIRTHAEALELNETNVLEKLKKQLSVDNARCQEDTRQEVGKLRRRIRELEQMIAKLYEDKVSGTITEAAFTVLIQRSEQEHIQKMKRLDMLLSEVKKSGQTTANIQNWASAIRKHLHLEELNREAVDELIDHIEIGERTVVGGRCSQKVKVFYRFVGQIET